VDVEKGEYCELKGGSNVGARFSKGDLLFNEYQIGDLIQQDAVFCWVHGININSGTPIKLQILREGIAANRSAELFDYFYALQRIKRKGFIIPELILQNAKFPLVMVYPLQRGSNLANYLQEHPEQAQALWQQASDLLHILHNQKIVHGLITEDCFTVVDGQVQLGKFGYGLLLSMGNKALLAEYKDAVPPNFKPGASSSSATDIYGYAKVVAAWRPSLVGTGWLKRALATNQVDGYLKIRDVYRGLEEAIAELGNALPQGDKQGSTSSRTNLVPKFRLVVKADPPSGGKVSGGGVYYPCQSFNIEAAPNKGWRFVGWAGDLQGTDCIATVALTENKTIIGKFKRWQPTVPLASEGGSLDQVDHSRGGNFNTRMFIPVVALLVCVVAGAFYFGLQTPAVVKQTTTLPKVPEAMEKNATGNQPIATGPSQVTAPSVEVASSAPQSSSPDNGVKVESAPKTVVEKNESPITTATTSAAPANWEVDARLGVKIANSGAKNGEVISWSGGNVNGYADGNGTLSYFRGGVLQRQMKGNWNQGRLVNGSKVVTIYPDRQVTGYVKNGMTE